MRQAKHCELAGDESHIDDRLAGVVNFDLPRCLYTLWTFSFLWGADRRREREEGLKRSLVLIACFRIGCTGRLLHVPEEVAGTLKRHIARLLSDRHH
jgi:hypothetical protein